MGRIGDSFKREIGKNTGKAVSNFLFGDSHSTPYRRVDQERRTAIAEKKADAEIERRYNAELNSLNAAVLRNVDIVLQTQLPHDEKGLIDLLSMWAAQLETTKWRYGSKEGRIHNQYSNALLGKYYQALLMFGSIAPANALLGYFQSQYNKAKRKKRLSKIFKIYGVLGMFLFVGLIVVLMLVGGVKMTDNVFLGLLWGLIIPILILVTIIIDKNKK